MKSNYFYLPLFLLITMCQPKSTTPEKMVDSIQKRVEYDTITFAQNFTGTFEYYGGAWEYGYLYYRMDIQQAADNLNGKLFLGNYLSKSEAGGYVQPDATFEADFHGQTSGDREAVIYLDNMRDSIATDNSSSYPDISTIFTTTGQQNLKQFILLEGKQLKIICNKDTMYWDRIK